MKVSQKEKQKELVVTMTKDQAIEKMREINNRHRDNMDSRKNAMSIIMGSIPAGGKIFAMIALEDIHVDKSYQRAIQNHIKVLTKEWNPIKCDQLKVNYREDGFFYVWDGQHRREAALARGIEYLLCDVTVGLTQEEEAALFGRQGDGIKKPDPYDIFKANVCAGEKIDTAIKNICDKYDLLVKRGKTAGNMSCLTLARDIFNRGDNEYFEWVLELLHVARWNEFPQSHCHRIINSLYEIRRISRDENEYIRRKLVTYLKKTNPDELLRNATVKYVQYKDESKRIKLFLLDVISGDNDLANTFVSNQEKFIA